MGDYIGDCCRGYEGGTRNEDIGLYDITVVVRSIFGGLGMCELNHKGLLGSCYRCKPQHSNE